MESKRCDDKNKVTVTYMGGPEVKKYWAFTLFPKELLEKPKDKSKEIQAEPEEVVAEPVEDTSKFVEIKSPMIGTFYRRSSPDKPNFVEVGTEIKKGDVICIIEAMKLFNEIEAEVSGKIVKALVDDSTPVEYDQPLFVIDPS